MLDGLLDYALATALVWLAWKALTTTELFRAVVVFIAFGLLMALAWARLEAYDIALAEAAIGAGLTGALLLDALRRPPGRPPCPGLLFAADARLASLRPASRGGEFGFAEPPGGLRPPTPWDAWRRTCCAPACGPARPPHPASRG